MVTASHGSTKSCGFDPRLGLRNNFLRICEVENRLQIVFDITKLLHVHCVQYSSQMSEELIIRINLGIITGGDLSTNTLLIFFYRYLVLRDKK